MSDEPVTALHGAKPRRRWVPILVSVAVVVCVAGAVVLPIWLPRELRRQQAETQLQNIRLALETYAADVRLGMALPPSGVKTPNSVQSGAESVCFYLNGPRGRGHTLVRQGMTSIVAPFYPPQRGEEKWVFDPTHPEGPNWLGFRNIAAGYGGRLFVDTYSIGSDPTGARPVLYFKARAGAEAATAPFDLSDNQAILEGGHKGRSWAPSDYRKRFIEWIRTRCPPDVRGLLIGPGPDRTYLTDDDVVVFF